MVASELQPLAKRGGSQRGWRRWGLAIVAVAAVAVAIGAVAQMGSSEQDLPVEALAWGKGKRLNAKEKAFVALATSTPQVDLHRSTQFKDNEGSKDMDTWYDHQATALRAQNALAAAHLAVMKKAASTTAAKQNINNYFDKMAVGVGKENTREAQKNKGSGRAARAEMSLYFKQLAAGQSTVNEHDMARLRAEKRFHSRHGTATAATADINDWFDTLQAKTVANTIKERAAKPKEDPYSFVTPVAAKHAGGQAVEVHHHDEEGNEENTKQALNDINSYFDDLSSHQAMHNEKDRAAMNKHDEFKSATNRKLDSKSSQKDIDGFFSKMHSTTAAKDAHDRAALRKDSNPVNYHDGVNVAKHPPQGAAAFLSVAQAKHAVKDSNPVNYHDGVNVAKHPPQGAAAFLSVAQAKHAVKVHAAVKRAREQKAARTPARKPAASVHETRPMA